MMLLALTQLCKVVLYWCVVSAAPGGKGYLSWNQVHSNFVSTGPTVAYTVTSLVLLAVLLKLLEF
jgi:hypothetical protein